MTASLPARAEWRAWLPITKPNTARFNSNHHGTLAEWRQWVFGSKRRWSSSSTSALGENDVDETEDDDEWRRFQFGTFASHMSPTKQQNDQMKKIQKMTPPEIDPLWSHLTDDEITRSIEAVSVYVTEERRSKFTKVLGERTNFIRFVFENPINVNNCWACLRTFDSFGLQYSNVITQEETYQSEWRRQTMTSALGAQKWLSLKQESDPQTCIRRLREQGYRIAASDLHARAVSAYDVDWSRQKTAIVLGNEKCGISDAVRAEADILFYLPMKGFAESLNVSAFVASLCGILEHKGALSSSLSTISQADRNRILLTWLARSAPASLDVMRRAGIAAGNKIWDTVGTFSTRP